MAYKKMEKGDELYSIGVQTGLFCPLVQSHWSKAWDCDVVLSGIGEVSLRYQSAHSLALLLGMSLMKE